MAETKKKVVKATEVKKEETKVAAEKKVAEKKVAEKTSVKKAPAKKTPAKEPKITVSVQFNGKTYTEDEIKKIAKDVWKYDLGNKMADFKTAEIYVKPEDERAYFVVNGEVTGSFLL